MLEDAALRDAIIQDIIVSIDEWSETYYNEGPRKHLGGSIIGDICSRKLFYEFRHVQKPFATQPRERVGKLKRLFNRGHREEISIQEYLIGIGCKFKQTTTEQMRISDCDGHFGGSLDNVGFLPEKYGISEEIFFEFKTMNEINFMKLNREGVELAQPKHYRQMAVYGYKTQLRYCLYLVVNKNTDELYVDLVKVDWHLGERMIAKAKEIIYAKQPSPKIANTPTNFACKWCDFKDICWYGKEADKNCRSCKHSEPVANGQWFCNKHGGTIPETFTPIGCDAWEEFK